MDGSADSLSYRDSSVMRLILENIMYMDPSVVVRLRRCLWAKYLSSKRSPLILDAGKNKAAVGNDPTR